MKLITKYNRVNILATIVVLAAGSVCYYFIIRYTLIKQLDNALKVEEAEIKDFVHLHDRLPEATNYKDQHISFALTNRPEKRRFVNITQYDPRDGDHDPYRQLIFPLSVGGQLYMASVTKSEVETQYLVALIVLITVAVIVLLLLSLFLTNRLFLRRTWKPFYDTLHSIRQFNLSGKQSLRPQITDVDEFRDLDQAVDSMTHKIISDYESLKNFADNASHEMQTPLAIINSKLDLLIQSPNLDESQVKQVQAIYDGVGRLTKLNQSLLLLSKIENNQFAQVRAVSLRDILEEKLQQMEDLIQARHLRLEHDLGTATIEANEYLADILVNNLLNNAIRHNVTGGVLQIRLQAHELEISNSGPPTSLDPQEIFERFHKGDESEGTGLGLAIVKQICDLYHFSVGYHFADGVHFFWVRF
jgi:signal transduction histidine kinase